MEYIKGANMNKIKLSDETTYNVCNEQWNSETIGFTVITEDVATLIADVKNVEKTKHIIWLDDKNTVIGEWDNFTNLAGFYMEQNVCIGVDFDDEGNSKGNTYADIGYMVILDKVEPEYVSKEDYDDLLNAMLELASIIGGDD